MSTGENPKVVLEAVEAVVEAARSGAPLPPCEGIFDSLDAECP
jgi:hypothetical protein